MRRAPRVAWRGHLVAGPRRLAWTVVLLVSGLLLGVTGPAVAGPRPAGADDQLAATGIDGFQLTLGGLGLLAVGLALLASRWGFGSRPKHRA